MVFQSGPRGEFGREKRHFPQNAGYPGQRAEKTTDPESPKPKTLDSQIKTSLLGTHSRHLRLGTPENLFIHTWQSQAETSHAVPSSTSLPDIKSREPKHSQMVFGVRALLASMTSSRWLHMATNRSKNSFPLPSPYTSLPHFSISACMVPLRLKVLRHRMMRAK
jgi:hypothetical protein